MTQTEAVTHRVYNRYIHEDVLGEGPNHSIRPNMDIGPLVGMRNVIGIEIVCALTVWGLYELRYPLAWLGHVILRLI